MPYDNIIKICSISNNQVGPFPRPPFAPQIQSNRQWHQRMDTLPIHQNLNSNIASERFANALPPNHPFLQVSLNHMKTFALMFVMAIIFYFSMHQFVFHTYIFVGLCTYGIK